MMLPDVSSYAVDGEIWRAVKPGLTERREAVLQAFGDGRVQAAVVEGVPKRGRTHRRYISRQDVTMLWLWAGGNPARYPLSGAEVARIMGVSSHGVNRQLRRGLSILGLDGSIETRKEGIG